LLQLAQRLLTIDKRQLVVDQQVLVTRGNDIVVKNTSCDRLRMLLLVESAGRI
jgi:hypothetical protein